MDRHSTALVLPPSRRWAATLAAASLWAVGSLAHGANVDITSHDVMAAPAATAEVIFDFNFGAGTDVTSFNVSLAYDKALLGLDLTQSGATYHGATVDPTALFGADFTVNPADPSGLSAIWLPLAIPSPIPSFSGQAEVTLVYKLLPALTLGSSTPVTLTFAYSDQNADDGLVNSLPFSPVTATVTAQAPAAVPEPRTWMLVVAGIALLVARLSARQRRS